MIFRTYEENECTEIYNRYTDGGKLYFYERTDNNKIYHERLTMWSSNAPFIPDEGVEWVDDINGLFPLSTAFLTYEEALKHLPNFTEGGCRYCGCGATKIPVKIIEHIFEKE